MEHLEPGDQVKHVISGEEGVFKKFLPWTVGHSRGIGVLVDVSGQEKFWLLEETAFFERPVPKTPPGSVSS